MTCQLETSQGQGGDAEGGEVALRDATLHRYYLIRGAHGYPFVQLDTTLCAHRAETAEQPRKGEKKKVSVHLGSFLQL